MEWTKVNLTPSDTTDDPKPLSDAQITMAIQNIGMIKVRRVFDELVEGMRNGRPEGYKALRRLLESIEEQRGTP
jgi:hypothetical protein